MEALSRESRLPPIHILNLVAFIIEFCLSENLVGGEI